MEVLDFFVKVFLYPDFIEYAVTVAGMAFALFFLLFFVRGRREKKMSQPQCQLIYKFRR